MFWKVVGIVVVAWIALAILGSLLGALIEAAISVAIVGALAYGGYVVYKAISSDKKNDISTRF